MDFQNIQHIQLADFYYNKVFGNSTLSLTEDGLTGINEGLIQLEKNNELFGVSG